jgi:hypothetical protein
MSSHAGPNSNHISAFEFGCRSTTRRWTAAQRGHSALFEMNWARNVENSSDNGCIFAFLSAVAPSMVKSGKSNTGLRVRRVVDAPLHEVSGIWLRRGRNGPDVSDCGRRPDVEDRLVFPAG